MSKKPVLAGLLLIELRELLSGYPLYRSEQIHKWICSGVNSLDEMSNLPLVLRKELGAHYDLFDCRVTSELEDPDGTIKFGITLEDGLIIESVVLSGAEGRKTACLSTQAGCPIGCVFCKTGSLGFTRNLSAAEISGQFLHLRKENQLSHIVIMGMGEPLLNLDELRKALAFITEEEGLNISKRRITLSTCGILEGLADLTENGPDIRLALSLVTARPDLRERLMPVSRTNPLYLLKEALLLYQKKRERRITLEMVLLGGINTRAADADAAADFARGLNAVFNLIPWNQADGLEFEGRPLRAPASRETAEFAKALESRGLKVTRRLEKGRSISGACGQLGVVQMEH